MRCASEGSAAERHHPFTPFSGCQGSAMPVVGLRRSIGDWHDWQSPRMVGRLLMTPHPSVHALERVEGDLRREAWRTVGVQGGGHLLARQSRLKHQVVGINLHDAKLLEALPEEPILLSDLGSFARGALLCALLVCPKRSM